MVAMPVAALISAPSASNLRVKLGGLALARGRDLQRRGQLFRARPWLLFAGLLSLLDLTQAIAASRVRAFFQVFSIALGLVASLVLSTTAGAKAWLALALGLAISVSDFAFEIMGLRQEDVSCTIMDLSADNDRTSAIARTVADRDRILSFKSSHALYNREINKELDRQSAQGLDLTQVTWNRAYHPLPVRIQEWRRQILLNKYRNAKLNRPFNGKLVRQATSTEVIVRDRIQPISLQPTRYFDLMCSNYLTESFLVADRRSRAKIMDGLELIQDSSTGLLPRLESSSLANPIGVSTLAFDTDHQLILVEQSEFAQSSRNLWSPSGSGSLEPSDVHRSVARASGEITLVDVIRRGMNRELIEESHIRERAVVDSRVIGYFRWLNKGAKPEYVGVTLLNRPVTVLRRRLSEFRWVRGIEVGVPVNFDRLRDDPASAHLCLGTNEAERQLFAVRMSFPLYVALYALGERLREDDGPQFRRWFFHR